MQVDEAQRIVEVGNLSSKPSFHLLEFKKNFQQYSCNYIMSLKWEVREKTEV